MCPVPCVKQPFEQEWQEEQKSVVGGNEDFEFRSALVEKAVACHEHQPFVESLKQRYQRETDVEERAF